MNNFNEYLVQTITKSELQQNTQGVEQEKPVCKEHGKNEKGNKN